MDSIQSSQLLLFVLFILLNSSCVFNNKNETLYKSYKDRRECLDQFLDCSNEYKYKDLNEDPVGVLLYLEWLSVKNEYMDVINIYNKVH